jgi:hypothetical protein
MQLAIYTIQSCESLAEGIQLFLSSLEQAAHNVDRQFTNYFAKIVVQYLSYIPEESQKIGSPQSIQLRLSEVSQNVLELVLPYTHHQDKEIQKLSLNCLASWIANCTVRTELLIPILSLILQKMTDFELLDVISDVLTTFFSDKRLVGMEKTVPEMVLPIITNDIFCTGLADAIARKRR